MTITLTWQSVVTAGAVIGALLTLWKCLAAAVRWFDKQKLQDSDIQQVQKHHDEDMAKLRQDLVNAFSGVSSEQTMLTYGVLACLKGLKEQGCNGPVTEAIKLIEKHLNKEAHKIEL